MIQWSLNILSEISLQEMQKISVKSSTTRKIEVQSGRDISSRKTCVGRGLFARPSFIFSEMNHDRRYRGSTSTRSRQPAARQTRGLPFRGASDTPVACTHTQPWSGRRLTRAALPRLPGDEDERRALIPCARAREAIIFS